DGRGGTDASVVTVTVTDVNDPPVAADQAVTVDEDAVAAGTVTATDADADILTYGLGTAPAGGTATVDPTTGAYTYTPGPDYNGSDSFTVTVSDGRGGTDTSTVTLTVTALNDAPTISGLAESYVGTPQSELIAFRVGDVDVGQGLAVTVESSNESFVPTTSANLQLADLGSGDWTLIVVPEVGVAGTSWITVSVTDGTATSTATFLFEVI
ncbi:MAG TPA: cadherin-like domain-containing protein, partial [Acidimicrobiia bacterium]|nr:cadherin-like domain-containing protein [Acidimicrobiia bacterium]